MSVNLNLICTLSFLGESVPPPTFSQCTRHDSRPAGANRGMIQKVTHSFTYRQTGSPERRFRCFDPFILTYKC